MFGTMLLGTTGAVICLIALIYSTTYDILIATAFGLSGPWSCRLDPPAEPWSWDYSHGLRRRLCGVRWRDRLAVCSQSVRQSAFSLHENRTADAGAATLRMMSDTNWAGGGVGTYQALATIYRDAAGAPGDTAVNTITSMVLEWGHVGLLIAIVLLLQLLIVLFRGAISRGRDSFYAASAAACLVTAFCEACCDASFTDVTVQMLTAIIVGLGLAQTTGYRAA